MTINPGFSTLLAAMALALSVVVAAPAHADGARLIVKFRSDSAKAGQPARERIEKLSVATKTALTYVRAMATGAQVVSIAGANTDADARRAASTLAADPDVEYAVVDARRHPLEVLPVNDEFATGQPYLTNGPGAISAFDAWTVTHGSAATVVAVIDTGYRPHIDMTGRFLPGYDMISDILVANDGDGRDADASDPGDWIVASDQTGELADCKLSSSSWHGTSVAGIIAANTNNAIYTAGIDWNAKILPVRVLGKCGGYDSDIIDGVAWAAGLAVPGAPPNPHPAQVLNLSLGGTGSCPASYSDVFSAVLAHGVTRAIVVAAGNETADVANDTPASCPGVIAVASTIASGSLATYSNFGTGIAVSAPGGTAATRSAGNSVIALSNSGTTTPQGDSFRNVGGTSMSAPMVSGTISLMLAVAPALTSTQVYAIVTGTAKPFPAGASCTTDLCGAGIVDAGAAVRAAAAAVSPPGINYEGLWWNAPAGSESGWGINFAHQGNIIFATWFTYDVNGNPWWLVMTAERVDDNVFAGALYQTQGPPFNAIPFNPAAVTGTQVGSGVLIFSDADNGVFDYLVNGVSQSKSITRQVFGALPTCTFGAQPNLALATNYQDLWWASPAGSESGWGVNLTQQGDIIFATWFTYGTDGSPLWLSATAPRAASGVYSGALYRTSGPAFNAVPFDPKLVKGVPVGAATFSFTTGNAGTFAYTVNGVSQTKPITRQVFRTPGTACQ